MSTKLDTRTQNLANEFVKEMDRLFGEVRRAGANTGGQLRTAEHNYTGPRSGRRGRVFCHGYVLKDIPYAVLFDTLYKPLLEGGNSKMLQAALTSQGMWTIEWHIIGDRREVTSGRGVFKVLCYLVDRCILEERKKKADERYAKWRANCDEFHRIGEMCNRICELEGFIYKGREQQKLITANISAWSQEIKTLEAQM